MGNNVNLIDLLGLPEKIECPTCKSVIETYFNDHDIECGTVYENGRWVIRMYCDKCEKNFQYKFQLLVAPVMEENCCEVAASCPVKRCRECRRYYDDLYELT